MKTIKAYAIVRSGGKMDLFDARCPVYWLRKVALEEKREKSFSDSRVVRVEIREIPKKRGSK